MKYWIVSNQGDTVLFQLQAEYFMPLPPSRPADYYRYFLICIRNGRMCINQDGTTPTIPIEAWIELANELEIETP